MVIVHAPGATSEPRTPTGTWPTFRASVGCKLAFLSELLNHPTQDLDLRRCDVHLEGRGAGRVAGKALPSREPSPNPLRGQGRSPSDIPANPATEILVEYAEGCDRGAGVDPPLACHPEQTLEWGVAKSERGSGRNVGDREVANAPIEHGLLTFNLEAN